MRLPDNRLRVRWTKSPAILAMLSDYKPGNWGKVKRLRRHLHVLDASYERDGTIYAARVAYLRDHPFMRDLPKNAPRAVRSIYRKEVRLAQERAAECWDTLRAIDAANAAWAKYEALA